MAEVLWADAFGGVWRGCGVGESPGTVAASHVLWSGGEPVYVGSVWAGGGVGVRRGTE